MWLEWCIHTCERNHNCCWAGSRRSSTAAGRNNKQVTFKNCAPFTDCISEINNTQVDNAKDLDVVMSMYNLIGYSNSYLKTLGRRWQYHRNDANDDDIIDSEWFKLKSRFINYTNSIAVHKYKNSCVIKIPRQVFENSWNALNQQWIDLILTWSIKLCHWWSR